MLHPEVIAYAFARCENLLVRAINQRSSETTTSHRRLKEIERGLRNCPQAIASMGLSPFLRTQLQELEAEHDDPKAKLASLEPLTLRPRLRDTREFVESRLANLESMPSGEPRIARPEIAKHAQKITLTPEGRIYIASGTWDLLGGVAVTMVPGARIVCNSHKTRSTSSSPHDRPRRPRPL